MRIIATLLIAVVAGLWLLTWWLIAEPIGDVASSSRGAVALPHRVPDAPQTGPSTPDAPTVAPLASPRSAVPIPSAPVTGPSSSRAPEYPPGTAIDPFADGGPRPVFVAPMQTAPPNAPVRDNPTRPAP